MTISHGVMQPLQEGSVEAEAAVAKPDSWDESTVASPCWEGGPLYKET